jgi:tetraacyldisaccharide 4'-kinase
MAASRTLQRWLEARWYGNAPLPTWLIMLSGLFGALLRLRCWLYRHGVLRVTRLRVPVLVVGNLSVGGAGKTPLTIALVEALRKRGWRPGVVSRGYGRTDRQPRRVHADSPMQQVGDEPRLIAARTGCPVAVAARRVEAARLLLDSGEVDLIIADDGLQHYALDRSVEVLVVDGRRGLGNGRLLPAGPLREPRTRAARCDLVVINGEGQGAAEVEGLPMRLRLTPPRRLCDAIVVDWLQLDAVQAVAGIADPERFFAALRSQGLRVDGRGFQDHHRFVVEDFDFDDGRPLLMTEKDAGKCAGFARPHWLVVAVEAELPASFHQAVEHALRRAARALSAPTPTVSASASKDLS